jgi:predicted Holliday junction resolvase-like endonuclease
MIITILIGVCTILSIVLVIQGNHFKEEITKLKLELEEKDASHIIEKAKIHKNSKFKSSAVNWGFTVENFVPFIDTFPIPPEDVNFLGKPIDYVGFTDTDSKSACNVHFIEVKSGKSFLSQKQKNIKLAIEEGRVQWHEVRVAANTVKSE